MTDPVLQLKPKHKIGILTAAVVALAAGTATQTGFIPYWEGTTNVHVVKGEKVSIAIHQSFDPKRVYTVCSGHTNYDDPNLKPGDIYTIPMCRDVLESDLPKYNAQAASCLPPDFMVSNHEHVAIISFTLNVGQHNFCTGPVGRAFREGRREQGCRAMGQYVRSAGVVLKGLQNRRYDKFLGEIAWCLRDD